MAWKCCELVVLQIFMRIKRTQFLGAVLKKFLILCLCWCWHRDEKYFWSFHIHLALTEKCWSFCVISWCLLYIYILRFYCNDNLILKPHILKVLHINAPLNIHSSSSAICLCCIEILREIISDWNLCVTALKMC